MNWQIDFHSRALKFLKANKIPENKIIELIKKALIKFQGKDINIDIVKLGSEWLGFHRIRIGNLRIIAEFNFDKKKVYIEIIDYRGNVYK